MIRSQVLGAALALTALVPRLLGAAPPPDQPTIQVIRDLSFGSLLLSPQGGSATLTADGALIPDGSGLQPGGGPPGEPARFRLTGPPGARFTLQVDPRSPALTHPRGGRARLVQFDPLMEAQGAFDGLGSAEFRLGGRLEVEAGAAPGLYRATQVKLQLHVADARGMGTANATFAISALVRAPLRLLNLGPLHFGGLLPGSRPGTFEVLPGGGFRSSEGGPTLVRGVPTPATFYLDGPEGAPYTLQVPVRITLTGPGTPLIVEELTCSIPALGILPPHGLPFAIGGRLRLDPGQALGEYRGLFTVTVSYP